MKPRKPQPPFEFSFTMTRRGDGIAPYTVSLRDEAGTLEEARAAVAFLTRRMEHELSTHGEDDDDARSKR